MCWLPVWLLRRSLEPSWCSYSVDLRCDAMYLSVLRCSLEPSRCSYSVDLRCDAMFGGVYDIIFCFVGLSDVCMDDTNTRVPPVVSPQCVYTWCFSAWWCVDAFVSSRHCRVVWVNLQEGRVGVPWVLTLRWLWRRYGSMVGVRFLLWVLQVGKTAKLTVVAGSCCRRPFTPAVCSCCRRPFIPASAPPCLQ